MSELGEIPRGPVLKLNAKPYSSGSSPPWHQGVGARRSRGLRASTPISETHHRLLVGTDD